MEFYGETEAVINNEWDYSNSIPTAENIAYLVQYCEQVYNQLIKLIEDDEIRNQKIKYDLKSYNFKKTFGERFEVTVREKNYNTINCKNYNSYLELYKKGQLNNVDSIEIYLELDYDTGSNGSFIRHDNSFVIKFKPYEISFIRKSNYKDANMDQVEDTINEILKKFPVANTIFCTKNNLD